MNETAITRIYHPHAGNETLWADDPDTLGIARTLRLKPGDTIAGFNGDGFENRYRVATVEKRSLSARLLVREPNPRDPQAQLTVLLASTKGKTKERMVKELTALGVTRILVYSARRSVALPDKKQAERLHKIAIESCRQCQRSSLPSIEIVRRGLEHLPPDIFAGKVICFYENADWQSLPKLDADDDPVTLIFGPEGGLTPDETAFLQHMNARFCSLGKRILRAELAVSVGTALVQFQRDALR